MEYPHLTRPIHGPLGPQGPKAWNLGDFDKASASIKHSRKRSAAAKDWGSMASGIHGGNHGNIWWGATNLAKHMDSNSRHMEIFNKTQHDMIWHDQKKHETCGWNPVYHGLFTRIHGISMGFSTFNQQLRGAKEDRKTSEKMPPPGLLKHQPPQIGRWFFGGSVDRFSQKMGDFSGRFSRIVFFEMLGKPWKTQVFGCLVFEVTKNQRYSKANRRGFHMMATSKHFWWFQRDSTSLTTALTSGIFWGSFFGSPLRGLNLH